jgi:RNA polymerase sigma factor (sigma-70 family)
LRSSKQGAHSALLVFRYQAGDREALDGIVRIWERPLFYYIRRLVRSEEDSWDVLQNVWLQVIRKISRLRDPAAFAPWLYRIAHNSAVSHLRKNSSFDDSLEYEEEMQTPGQNTDLSFSASDAQEVHWALDQIKPPHREVVTLKFLEGFSMKEIAEIVGVTLGTVKSRLHYAKNALRDILEKEGRRHE